ncbi:MAG: hypothetical protein KGL44_11925 [Sphingomonadales bacterium]|nr:hypothetical protein [Sphingomonadales bacterium]
MQTVRNRRASTPPVPKPQGARQSRVKAEAAFPPDVAIAPHRGAVPTASAIPGPSPKPKPKAQPKRSKRAAKAKSPAVTAKAQRATTGITPPPVIALPPRAEPLVAEGHPAPLPRNRAPAPLRKEGLPGLIAQWLGSRARTLQGLLTPAPKRAAPARPSDEIARLRAENARLRSENARVRSENERLKLQIEALLALQAASAPAQPAVPG